ncbi:MAG: ribbon-helix-helix protein, CopG family [Thermoanaerobacterales bacterium]|nr:ribbon-helix-helix protein, CopG family [Thermoanaerobacterales bacterium]
MLRTQVQLTEQQFAALKAMAAAEGVSMAELIRRGVDLVLRSPGPVDREVRVRRAVAAAGRFRSGLGDLAARHDDYLIEAFEK